MQPASTPDGSDFPKTVSRPTVPPAEAGVATRWWGLSDRPWASGLTSFATTIMLLLPIEYEAPLRTIMLFASSRRF